MNIRVKVVAPFEIPGLAQDGSLELPEGARVRDLFRRGKAPAFTYLLPVSVNGRQVGRSHKLQDGDLVIVIAPVGGG